MTYAYRLDLDAKSPDEGFVLSQVFESPPTALKLNGSLFFTTDESNRIRIYNVLDGNLLYMLRVPLIYNDQTVFLEVGLIPNYDDISLN